MPRHEQCHEGYRCRRVLRQRHQHGTDEQHDDTRRQHAGLAEPACQRTDEQGLRDATCEADGDERQPHLAWPPLVAQTGPEPEHGLHGGEGDDGDEAHHQQAADERMLVGEDQGVTSRRRCCEGGPRGPDGFTQEQQCPQGRRARQRRGGEQWQAVADGAEFRCSQQAADGRTRHEAQIEGGTEETNAPRSAGRRCHVGDVAEHHGQCAAEEAAHDAQQTSGPEVWRKGKGHVTHGGAGGGDDEYGAPPDAVGELAPVRFAHQVAERIGGEQGGYAQRAGAEGLPVKRQEWQHEAEARDIDENDDEQQGERARRGGG